MKQRDGWEYETGIEGLVEEGDTSPNIVFCIILLFNIFMIQNA